MPNESFAEVVALPSNKHTYVEKHGPVGISTPADIPILFIHGFYMTLRAWDTIHPHFPDRTRIAYDVTPHGQTGASSTPPTMAALAAQARDVLAHFGYTQAVVVGHSSGALIALQLAQDFPGSVQQLVLLTPVEVPITAFMKTEGPAWVRLTTNAAGADAHVSFLGPRARTDPTFVGAVHRNFEIHADRKEAMDAFYEALTKFEFRGLGGAVPWIVGAQDDWIQPAESIQNTHEGIGCDPTHVLNVPGGHFVMWEVPNDIVDII